MAFIERKDPVVMNIKLTSKGRELLSSGQLDFKYYALGDGEIDYEFNKAIVDGGDTEYTAFDTTILRPADKNPDLISFIARNVSGDPYNELSNVPSAAYQVENQVESLGFFTNNNTEYIIDANHVKQPDAMVAMSSVSGGTGITSITLLKAPGYGTSGEEPAVGDILFIKWTKDVHTTGFTINTSNATPHLFYRITGITSGSLATGSVTVGVDRPIPNFTGGLSVYAGAMIYYNEINFSGDTILNMSPTDYLDESVLSFLENSQCPTVVFPYWNMSIIFTEEIAGVQAGNVKYTDFRNKTLGGFVSYIQNQAPEYKKLGVIHYTNSSPANVYGEGFIPDTPTLDIPTIMWHKSSTSTLGTTLSPIGGQQLLTGLNIYYYDLADPLGFVVGKMFPDLKIFVIEDQELLFAMSYKSNRSWTLPDYTANLGAIIPPCPTGIAVTWNQPTINPTYVGSFSVVCTEYCHSTSSGWIPFTGEKSLIGVEDTNYRITTCRLIPFFNSYTCICGVDIPTNTKFAAEHNYQECNLYTTYFCNGAGPLPSGQTRSSSYYYNAYIDED